MTRAFRHATRWMTRGLAVLFAAGALLWLLRVPYRPERAARAIPSDVHWVSRHDAPADRWAELAGNPVVRLFMEEGIGLVPPDTAMPLPERLRRLLSDRVWLAQAMPDSFSTRRAFYGSAWAGNRGRRLRWEINVFRPPAIERFGDHAGRGLYRLHVPDLSPEWRLTLAFEEGLVLFCLSENKQDLRRLLDTYDGRAPSILDVGRMPPADAADAARIRAGPGRDWALAMEAMNAERTSLRIEPAASAPSAFPVGRPETPVHPLPWGDVAAMAAHVRPGILASIPIPAVGLGPALSELRAVLLPLGDGSSAMFGLFGEPYTGRYRGIRVPGLVAAWKTEAAWEDVDAAVSRALDRLNARHQWGWIPADGPPAPPHIRVIAGTRIGAGALPTEETPAYALHDGFLWLASNARTLQALLLEKPAAAAVCALHVLDADEDVLVQTDLAGAESTLRLAYHVYRLFQIVEQRTPAPNEEAAMGLIERGLDEAGRFGKMEIGIRWHPAGPVIRGTVTHPQPAATCTD